MAGFLPPESRDLPRLLARRNARRVRRVIQALGPSAVLRALAGTLDGLRGGGRIELLCDPGMRAWLWAAEEAVALSDQRLTDMQLFDRLARGPHLASVMPGGRIGRGFRARASALGAKLTARALLRLPPLLAFRTPPRERYGPFRLDLASDGEEARITGEVRLYHPGPATLRMPQGSKLELVLGGVRVSPRGRSATWCPSELIAGSGIALTRRVISTRVISMDGGLRAGPRLPEAGRRLAGALELLGEAWPYGHAEVLAHTRMVVPLIERGTVSYSFPDRPGVSYINMAGKTRVDLADDLLHESAHHRLHGLEELSPLVRAGRDADEPRYWSAWRRNVRPLRGILHAAYTFAWRAELLARLVRLPGRLPRAWMRRELDFEITALRLTVADLEDAADKELLTQAGAWLVGAIASRVSAMPASLRRRKG